MSSHSIFAYFQQIDAKIPRIAYGTHLKAFLTYTNSAAFTVELDAQLHVVLYSFNCRQIVLMNALEEFETDWSIDLHLSCSLSILFVMDLYTGLDFSCHLAVRVENDTKNRV